MKYKCNKCPYCDDKHIIPIISDNHPIYYEDVLYCGLSGDYELTAEDLQIQCPLEVNICECRGFII